MSKATDRARAIAVKASDHAANLDNDWQYVGQKPLRQTIGDLVDAIHLLADELDKEVYIVKVNPDGGEDYARVER